MNVTQQRLNDLISSGQQTAAEIQAANTYSTDVTRRAYLALQQRVRHFAYGEETKVWVAMPGLRGIGKTTILSQLYNDPVFSQCTKIFASFDRVKTLGASMADFIQACEDFIGAPIEKCEQPIALFLDEVQYLEDWAVGLKTIVDRSNKIVIICTGSSALSLQMDANVARRIDIIKLHPLCFTEYVLIKQAHLQRPLTLPVPGLAKSIREALFSSANALEAYTALHSMQTSVQYYWSRTGFGRNESFGEYMAYGTLPFTLDLPNRATIWDRINRMLSESLDRDVIRFGRLDAETVAMIPQALFLLASSSETSINNLCSDLKLNQRTVTAILTALEKTEIITAIPPKGAHNGNIRKPTKYLFTSPAMRAALCNFGGIITPDKHSVLRGELLEDVTGLYLKRLFLDSSLTRSIVEYDTAKGGADFIISADGTKQQSIALEVGARKQTTRQALQTLEAIGGKYGIVLTSSQLSVQKDNNIVIVPFEYFFLI